MKTKELAGDDNTGLLSSRQAAAFLGIKANTLKVWRWRGIGPRFVRLGDRPGARVVYRRADILAWIEDRTFDSTSAATVGETSR